MNKVKNGLLFVITILACFMITGCDKDEAMEGKVYITFINSSPDIRIAIYSTCNEKVPIYDEVLKDGEVFEYILNAGTYFVEPYSRTSLYNKTGFQILQNKTTHIQYDSSVGKVKQ